MRSREGISKAPATILVILVILGGYFAYSDHLSLLQQSSLQVSQIDQLERQVSELQGNNEALQGQLASGGANSSNSSLLGLNPVSIYRMANPSVVTITGDQVTSTTTFFGVQQNVATIIGSGFVIQYLNSYYVVTNFHVVNGVTNMTATFSNGDSYVAKVVGTDPYSDLGIVTVNAPSSEFSPLQIAPSSLSVGQPVVAIGNPFGLSGSMTFGIISQLGRTLQESTAGNFLIADVIQFSAPINPGNSGGPLLNSDGMVVGITTAVVGGSQGVGFAIPSGTIMRELALLISTGGYNLHPYIGIGSADMNYQIAKLMHTNVTYGVLLQNVISGGSADRAGLKAGSRTVTVDGTQYLVGGDIIVSLNGTRIINSDALSSYLQEHVVAGQTISVGFIRNGTSMNAKVIVAMRPPAPSG